MDVIQELVTGSGRKSVLKNKNKDGRTPLHLAAKGNHPAAVAKLIESGARVDAKDKVSNTLSMTHTLRYDALNQQHQASGLFSILCADHVIVYTNCAG